MDYHCPNRSVIITFLIILIYYVMIDSSGVFAIFISFRSVTSLSIVRYLKDKYDFTAHNDFNTSTVSFLGSNTGISVVANS